MEPHRGSRGLVTGLPTSCGINVRECGHTGTQSRQDNHVSEPVHGYTASQQTTVCTLSTCVLFASEKASTLPTPLRKGLAINLRCWMELQFYLHFSGPWVPRGFHTYPSRFRRQSSRWSSGFYTLLKWCWWALSLHHTSDNDPHFWCGSGALRTTRKSCSHTALFAWTGGLCWALATC